MSQEFCAVAAQVMPVLLLTMVLRRGAWTFSIRSLLNSERIQDIALGSLMAVLPMALVGVEGLLLWGASRADGLERIDHLR